MTTFKDSTGHEWKLELTIGLAMTVRDRLGLDLLQPEQGEPPVLTRLGTDELLLAEVILAFIEGQMAKLSLSAESVLKRFDANTIHAAHMAFYTELVNFFQSRGRPDRAEAIKKQAAILKEAAKIGAEKIAEFDVKKTVDGVMFGK